MTTTILPPIGTVWANTKDPHDIVIVKGYNTVAPSGDRTVKNNIVKLHQVNTNTPTIELLHMFTWHYKPLETMETK